MKTREQVLSFILNKFVYNHFLDCQIDDFKTNNLVSVGIPKRGKAVGEIWYEENGNGKNHIFIHPGQEELVNITGILIHEILHTIHKGHRKDFASKAVKLGLKLPATSTTNSDELSEKIKSFLEEYQIKYPHNGLLIPPGKKQSTRMLKIICKQCEYILRGSKQAIEENGLPTCPCGEEFQMEDTD